MTAMSLSRASAAEAAPRSPFAARLLAALRGRRALGELARLDPRILADIGLTRGDVAAAFERPMVEDPTLYLAGLRRTRARAF